MRQKLATARQSTHLESAGWAIEAIAESAKADRLGRLLSRGLDSLDAASLAESRVLLANLLRRAKKWPFRRALLLSEMAIAGLVAHLCGSCGGRRYLPTDNGVKALCGGCNGSGRAKIDADDQLHYARAVALAALGTLTKR
jgi:hypothetical protein